MAQVFSYSVDDLQKVVQVQGSPLFSIAGLEFDVDVITMTC